MKPTVGDLVLYGDECNDRMGTIGLVIEIGVMTNPPTVRVMWESGDDEVVYSDELIAVASCGKVYKPHEACY